MSSTFRAAGTVKSLVRQSPVFPQVKAVQERLSPQRRRGRAARLAFYSALIKPGDLTFDVGANIGSRSETFLELGARVIAVEPQPLCCRTLQSRFGRNDGFTLIPMGLGDTTGEAPMRLASSHVLASMSQEFIDVSSYEGNEWGPTISVRVTTLDALIAVFGLPVFCKIDVEGFELQVLRGLTQPLPSLSLEYNPQMSSAVTDCLDRLDELGDYEYAFSHGESMSPLREWFSPSDAKAQAAARGPWGDFYARLRSAGD